MDFRTYREKKVGFWVETRASVPCILPADGLLAIFLLKDVEKIFDEKYPHRGTGQRKVWYFNETRDREIAEVSDDRIYANPSALVHFMNVGG